MTGKRTIEPGRKLGHFEVRSTLGAGGMGEVYLARDLKLSRDVALKLIRSDREIGTLRKRFAREATILASLNHPGIATLHDLVTEEGHTFLVMELVEGPTLEERLLTGPLALEEARQLFMTVAEALEAAHERGVIHRDLKPANIKLGQPLPGRPRQAKLLDFGIAKSAVPEGYEDDPTLAESEISETSPGAILGTVGYMPPEQVRGLGVDKRADIWAYGCCLYEALSGRVTFGGRTAADRMAAILSSEPDWSDLPEDTPQVVLQLLRRCLVKDSDLRLRDIGEARIQLKELANLLEEPFEEVLGKTDSEIGLEEGAAVPRRANWKLERHLGEGGFGEVWLAHHEKTGAKRVFKFCRSQERLRGLRREIALLRLLRQALGERTDIAQVLDWELGTEPCFLEMEYTEGGDLLSWSKEQGGLEAIPLATRVDLVCQIATALGAAHRVGILHKDVKPGNVLVAENDSQPRAVLSDFGIGVLTGPEAIRQAGVTVMGMTETLLSGSSSGIGTQLYLAPEIVEGKQATTRSDIYSLGVLLYQMVTGDLGSALSPGWEVKVSDPLLLEDIRGCVSGIPEQRFSASELVDRLSRLAERRDEHEAARLAQERESKRQRRMRLLAAAAVVLTVLSALSAFLLLRERELRAQSNGELYLASIRLADLETRDGDRIAARAALESAPEPFRAWEWEYLNEANREGDPEILEPDPEDPFAVWTNAEPVVHLTLEDASGATATFSPDGSVLYTGGVGGHKENVVMALDPETGESLWQTDVGFDVIVIGEDRLGELLLASEWNGRMALLEATTGRLLTELDPIDGPAFLYSFSPDNRFLLVSDWTQVLAIDLETRSVPRRVAYEAPTFPVATALWESNEVVRWVNGQSLYRLNVETNDLAVEALGLPEGLRAGRLQTLETLGGLPAVWTAPTPSRDSDFRSGQQGLPAR